MRASSRTGRARALVIAAALVVAVPLGLAGCSGGRESLGTTDGPCYVALPTASQAVGTKARLDGVRLMKVSAITYPHLGSALRAAHVTKGRVCLVAFKGSFSAATVSHPAGRTSGHLAVVVLRYPDGKLIATVLFHRLPTRFGHSHLG
ncbi:MAG: hypothetical protein ACRDYB_14355 [Acidimicrobiales bacterium]